MILMDVLQPSSWTEPGLYKTNIVNKVQCQQMSAQDMSGRKWKNVIIHPSIHHISDFVHKFIYYFMYFHTSEISSSAFNTVIPQHLIKKLCTLGISAPLCNWIMDFLTNRPQAVQVGKNRPSLLAWRPLRVVSLALFCLSY